jgi:hypothetical protein
MQTRIVTAFVLVAFGLGAGNAPRADDVEVWVPLEIEIAILRDPALVEYFHLELPDRQPVKVSSLFSHPDLGSANLGYSVKVVQAGSPELAQAFQFGQFDISDHHASVEVSYPLEGVTGRYSLVRRGKKWVIEGRSLSEH